LAAQPALFPAACDRRLGLKNRAAGWALILTMLLGSADELQQRFVPQRTSTITDVGFDLCGAYFALIDALRRHPL
jgi:VanZ family protein